MLHDNLGIFLECFPHHTLHRSSLCNINGLVDIFSQGFYSFSLPVRGYLLLLEIIFIHKTDSSERVSTPPPPKKKKISLQMYKYISLFKLPAKLLVHMCVLHGKRIVTSKFWWPVFTCLQLLQANLVQSLWFESGLTTPQLKHVIKRLFFTVSLEADWLLYLQP